MFSRVIGLVSVGLLFVIKFYIATTSQVPKTIDYRMLETLRIGVLWTSVYVFFIFVLQIISFFNIGSLSERRIISSWASVIPLAAICIHWYLSKKLLDHQEKIEKKTRFDRKKTTI